MLLALLRASDGDAVTLSTRENLGVRRRISAAKLMKRIVAASQKMLLDIINISRRKEVMVLRRSRRKRHWPDLDSD